MLQGQLLVGSYNARYSGVVHQSRKGFDGMGDFMEKSYGKTFTQFTDASKPSPQAIPHSYLSSAVAYHTAFIASPPPPYKLYATRSNLEIRFYIA